MNISKINVIAFSPCFSTDKTAETVAEELSNILNIECIKDQFTLVKDRERIREYAEDELLVIASPTYAGKLPNKILPDFQSKIKGQNTKAVAIVTYGNRSYDNSLAELCDTLKENGFCVIAAAAIVNEHTMSHLAARRPNKSDLDYLKQFAKQIADKISNDDLSEPPVPGDSKAAYYTPLQENGEPAKFLKASPKTNDNCVKCGACARNCPMGSISTDDFVTITGICIKCHSCINRCTKNAKYFDDPQLLSHIRFLQQNYSEDKENECYI